MSPSDSFARTTRILFTLLAWILAITAGTARAQNIVWAEDFEFGGNGWSASGGVWQIGQPAYTAGPSAAFEGQYCAGTNLTGDYPNSINTRLESPSIALPSVEAAERLLLRFRYWEHFHLDTFFGTDHGILELHEGGTWKSLAGSYRAISPVWTQGGVDLTAWAGKTVRLGFRLLTGGASTAPGWYFDALVITKGPVVAANADDFHAGHGEWLVSNGSWEIGDPTNGSGSCLSGNRAATHLNGNYWDSASTRLESPPLELTPKPGETPTLRFSHWFRFHTDSFLGLDSGRVQISAGNGAWTDLGVFTGNSTGCTNFVADLSSYAGSSVRIGFLLQTGGGSTDQGWHVDNVEVLGIVGHVNATFTPYGAGTAGSGGVVPQLLASDGSAIGGYVVRVKDGLGGASGLYVVATAPAATPFMGGTLLVDVSQPTAYLPILLLGSASPPGSGFVNVMGPNVLLLSGHALYVQVLLSDPGAVLGVAMTNGLKMTVGP